MSRLRASIAFVISVVAVLRSKPARAVATAVASESVSGKGSAPVFRTIADKVFAYDVALHPAKNRPSNIQKIESQEQTGYAEDFRTVSEELGLQNAPTSAGWLKATKNGNSVAWRKIEDADKDLPN